MHVLTIQDLIAGVREPNWADRSSQAALIVEAGNCPKNPDALDELLFWLQFQPIPVIGIASTATGLDDGFDLLVPDESACEMIYRHIEKHPRAATILVQTVRETTAAVSLRGALTLESLAYATLQGGSEYQRWLAQRPAPRPTNIEDPLLVEKEGTTLHVCLDSPANRNAVGAAMRDALAEVFNLAVIDPQIHRVLVTGNGPNFSAGGDLHEFGLSRDTAEAHHVRQLRMPGQYIAMAPHKFHFHLHGACVGAGIEMPAFAETVIADPDTVFRLPEVGFGLIPGAGGCVSIPKRIGKHRMNELAITGRQLGAEEALHWGLIDAIEPTGGNND